VQPNYPAKTTASVTPTPPRKNTPRKNKAMNKEKDAKDASDLEEPEKDGVDPEELAKWDHSWRLTADSVAPTAAETAQHCADLRASKYWQPTRGGPVQLKPNHSPGKAALPPGTSPPPRQPRSKRTAPTSTVPSEENNPDEGLTEPTRETSARAPTVGNANSVESVTIRNLQASVERLQKCATATIPELAAARKQAEEARKQAEEARKQAEEGASRLNALEAQMSRVFPPAANKGRGKGKSGANVLLETRVSDLEKAGAINTNTAKSKAKEVTSIASALSKATTEIAKLKNQLEASVAAPAAEHVQDVALQEAVDSNTTRIAVTEAAIQTLASFKTQLVDLQQKVSTIEVSMSPAAPESNSHRPTAPKRQRTKRVETKGSARGDAETSGESTPAATPRKKSRSKKSTRHRSRTRSRTRSRSRSSARGRSTETSPRKTTPSKRYDVCMTCV